MKILKISLLMNATDGSGLACVAGGISHASAFVLVAKTLARSRIPTGTQASSGSSDYAELVISRSSFAEDGKKCTIRFIIHVLSYCFSLLKPFV